MKRPPIARVVAVRDNYISTQGWKVIRSDAHGLRRIALADGSADVDVWLTTGSWSVVGLPELHMNDWAGFLSWMAVME